MAADLKDSMKKPTKRFRGRGAMMFLIGMILLGAIVLFIWVKELASPGVYKEDTQNWVPPARTEEQIQTTEDVQELLEKWEPLEETQGLHAFLVEQNMFDWKRVESAEALETQADEMFQRALLLYRQQPDDLASLREAADLLDQAFNITPTNQRIRNLRDEVYAKLAEMESAEGAAEGEGTVEGAQPPAGQPPS